MQTSEFRLRRGVPLRRQVGGQRFSLGINDLRADPPEVVVGVHSPDGSRAEHLTVGDVLDLSHERWQVSAIVPGARGTVDFVRASKESRPGDTR